MGLELQGIDDVMKNFEKINRQVEKNLTEALKKGGQKVLTESNNMAPRDTGEMVRESDVKEVSPTEFRVRYNTDYSLYVHEDLEARHPRGGQAKFLQTATNDNGRDVIKDISKELLK
jgi:HK97 gp10 family phage protein